MPMMTADADEADSAPQNEEEDERQGEDSDRRSTDSNATPTQEGDPILARIISYDDKQLLQAVCPTCCPHHLRFGAMVFVTVVCS